MLDIFVTVHPAKGKSATHEIRLHLEDYHKLETRAKRRKLSVTELIAKIISHHHQPEGGYKCAVKHGAEIADFLLGKRKLRKK